MARVVRLAPILKAAQPQDGGGRKPKGRGHERRDEIMAAARRMFVERGVANVSTRAIADALGISQTTLYVYFPTKDAIFDAVCEASFTTLVAAFRKASALDAPAPKRLRSMMRAYIEFGLQNSDDYRIAFMTEHGLHGEKVKNFSLPPEEQPAGIQCFMLMQSLIDELAAAGVLNCEPALAAQVIWAAGHGLVSLLITMPDFPWAERDELIERGIDVQMLGLLHSSPLTDR